MCALFSNLCYNNAMLMEEKNTKTQGRVWYKNIWILLGLFLAGVVLAGLTMFIYQTYNFYADAKGGRADFMPISEPTAEMKMQTLLKEKQRQKYRDIVKGKEGDPYFGSVDAEHELVLFADFGCPYCKMAVQIVEEIKNKRPDIKISIRDFPIVELHPESFLAAKAARCVWAEGDPDKYHKYHNLLYAYQGNHDADSLMSYARQLGIDKSSFTSCLNSREIAAQINESITDAEKAGVTATPTFFADGIKVEGVFDAGKYLELLK